MHLNSSCCYPLSQGYRTHFFVMTDLISLESTVGTVPDSASGDNAFINIMFVNHLSVELLS